ncbi:unnamed protein product [Rotaria sp. Silwood1]|nr:unnamed protein product [Rotaria sp. Silwood1]
MVFNQVMSYLLSLLEHSNLDLIYLSWLWNLFKPLCIVLLTLFLLPAIILIFMYCSSLFCLIYKHWNRLKAAYSEDLWYGAIKTLAVFWELQATIWHGLASLLEALEIQPSTLAICKLMLEEGHILAIAPGGVREALFGDQNYHLIWKERKGFAKLAIDAKVPIIPMFTKNCREAVRAMTLGRLFLGGHVQTVFKANRPETASELDSLCARLIAPFEPQTTTLDVNGRDITIPWQARGVIKFSFDELCGQEYFSADYIAIASTYHTLILTDIPKLNIEQRDRIRRFIILIDELYNYHTKLIISMYVHTVKDIFNPLKDNPNLKREDLLTMDEFHSFDRTISRLIEMQSKEYLSKPKRFGNKKNVFDEWAQLQ